MPSFQQSAGAGKAAKFVAANPLGPMADPFAGLDGDEQEYQKELSENVNRRLTKAMGEIKERHARGTNTLDDPDRAPTGSAYKEHYAHQRRQEQGERARDAARSAEEHRRQVDLRERAKTVFDRENDGTGGEDEDVANGTAPNPVGEDDGSDSDDEAWLDEDPELDAIRARRIAQLKATQESHATHLALGHGCVRTINQDEFLPECTGKSEFVAVHFFHKEFERCKIMDHHLKIVAPLHIDCKFLRMDAERCPFFIQKLQVKTLPTLIVFREGKIVDKLTGFEGLAVDIKEPDKWHTGRLRQWIAGTGAIQYTVPTEEVREEMERMGMKPRGIVWTSTKGRGYKGDDYDEDDES